jgi:hypothetical protein
LDAIVGQDSVDLIWHSRDQGDGGRPMKKSFLSS